MITEAEPGLTTEFSFELPRGFVDAQGQVHRRGVMRLATARDELLPLRDHRVRDNDAYITVLLLSRVLVSLGDLPEVNPSTIEGLFTADLAYLQNLYQRLNIDGGTEAEVTCPHCSSDFTVDMAGDASGES